MTTEQPADRTAALPTVGPDGAVDPATDGVSFHTRKWVKPEDLNANGTLFGGSLLRWIDEQAAIYAIIQLGNHRAVTKLISEINFVSSARQGDMIEMGLKATHFGRTSLTMRAEVRNMITRQVILTIERIVFVSLGEDGHPAPHGYTGITYHRDRLPVQHRDSAHDDGR
ncbi:hotdog domain-containing protein [Citricoccus sp. I39-566]|uniref:acyl-CoA thioesterase n=1 Tax=Citricoccus sp. I39-566 TaxID=3073268 RepID=UPI00286B8519|nr:hotdog domain-containing protein [Citricoccus sp. I39-566]WMY79146.1 hotdog domain-containing protein [Citricoccus sp. I39-566]